MLVLSRKLGETLVIGGNITVKITQITGSRVSIGIDAPKEVRVVRGELHEFQRSEKGALEERAKAS